MLQQRTFLLSVNAICCHLIPLYAIVTQIIVRPDVKRYLKLCVSSHALAIEFVEESSWSLLIEPD